MKGFTTLVLVVAIATATVVMGQTEQDVKECKDKVGATNADVEKLNSNAPVTTRTAACLMACIQKKLGVLDKNNKINLTAVKKQMEPLKQVNQDAFNKLSKIADECKAQENSDSDECEIAKNLDNCIMNKRKEAGLT